MRKAVAIELDEAQREQRVRLAHSNTTEVTTEVRLARRAGIVLIVLLAADGLDNPPIGALPGGVRARWRRWPGRATSGSSTPWTSFSGSGRARAWPPCAG